MSFIASSVKNLSNNADARVLELTPDDSQFTLASWNTATGVLTSGVDANGVKFLSDFQLFTVQQRLTDLLNTISPSRWNLLTHALASLICVASITGEAAPLGYLANDNITMNLDVTGFTATVVSDLIVAIGHSRGPVYFPAPL